jgi:hypothetical protein
MELINTENWAETLYGLVALTVIGVSLYAVNSARLGSRSSWEIWSEQNASRSAQATASSGSEALPLPPGASQ